jgi:flagellar biosynthesis protein FlhF
MNSRVFRGRTLFDARKSAQESLGKAPVVLTTRSVRRPGLAGLFGGADVEIAAAVAPTEEPSPARRRGPFALSAYSEPESAPARDSLTELRAELRGEIRAVRVALGRPAAPRADRTDEVLAEMSAMRKSLDLLMPAPTGKERVMEALRATAIEGAAATSLSLSMRVLGDEKATADEVLRDALADVIRVAPWPLATEGRAVIALVGATGVGKTTTIAKLAARAKMDGRTMTLVTCDTFRVGAVEQTRRYAELLRAPFEMARSASELADILARAATDIVFVDTSGRAPVADAAEHLLASETFEACAQRHGFTRHVLLCVAASIRANDAVRTSKAFSHTNPNAISVAKIDETDAPAGLVHAAFVSKLPVSILCAGPRVPEDIAPATMGAILDELTRRQAAKAVAA